MNPLILTSLLGAITLSIFKYFEDHICFVCKKRGQSIISFIVGATIITIFVELLNDVYQNVHNTNNLFIVLLPISFIAVMLIERHIHMEKNRWHRQQELKALIRVISFVSGFVIGLVSLLDMQSDLFKHIIFVSFLLSFDFIRELSIRMLDKPKKRSKKENIFYTLYCLSPIYGFLTAYFLPVDDITKTVILAIFGGAIMYFISKEVIISREEKVLPSWLLLGAMSMISLFLLSALV